MQTSIPFSNTHTPTPDNPDKQSRHSVDVGAWKSRYALLPLDSRLFGSPQEQNVPTPPNIFSCGCHDRTSSCEWPYKSPRDKWIRFCRQIVPRCTCGREDRESSSQCEVDLAFLNAMNDDQERCGLNVQSGGVNISCDVEEWDIGRSAHLSPSLLVFLNNLLLPLEHCEEAAGDSRLNPLVRRPWLRGSIENKQDSTVPGTWASIVWGAKQDSRHILVRQCRFMQTNFRPRVDQQPTFSSHTCSQHRQQ
ncbi:MAG: hypothetical protein J3Q66DRAFT_375124 [Benniella sp.]|nr:MAG: hypothetical protein J3Q66DRAFT_375124 [Benniella sp.]